MTVHDHTEWVLGCYLCDLSATENCAFCAIIEESSVSGERYLHGSVNSIGITPLNPVVEGHFIAIPRLHVPDAVSSPRIAGVVMEDAARWAYNMGPVNLITSVGEAATQSVFHLHVHVVPRSINDGLALPWHSGRGRHVPPRE